MWTEPVVTVAAGAEPVSLAEAKDHCRISGADDDAILEVYIAAARDFAEKYTGLKLAKQTVSFCGPSFATGALPVAPIRSISIEYRDTAGVLTALQDTVYELSGVGTLVPVLELAQGQSWPTVDRIPEAVCVTAQAGFEAVPDAVKASLLLHIGHLFDNRAAAPDGAMSAAPLTTIDLLENYRTFQ